MPRVETTGRTGDARTIEEAAQALREGKLVVLPTETVYGLAARADDPRVVERVRATKDRPPTKPFARLVADVAAVEAVVGPLPPVARKLAQRFWPGPLTLVIAPESGGEALGFRVPALVFAREVVRRAGVPVLATSANRSGGEEPTTAAEAVAFLGEGFDVAFDAGPAPLGRPSTVVRLAPDERGFEILREGFLDRETLSRALSRVVLFVCTGNTCRSPMAEGIAKAKLAARLHTTPDRLEGMGYGVRSAGTSAIGGGSAADQAIEVMRERGIDIHDHRSRPLTPDLVDGAEAIFVMSSSHAHTIEEWFPDAAPKVRLLDPEGVPDPVGQSVERYRETADLLSARIDEALDELGF